MWVPRSPTERTRPDDQGKGTVTVWHRTTRERLGQATHINEQKIILKDRKLGNLSRTWLDLRGRRQMCLDPDNIELFTARSYSIASAADGHFVLRSRSVPYQPTGSGRDTKEYVSFGLWGGIYAGRPGGDRCCVTHY